MDQERWHSAILNFQPAIAIEEEDVDDDNDDVVVVVGPNESTTSTSTRPSTTTPSMTRTSSISSMKQKNKNNTSSTNKSVVIDRYKADMEQALAMKATLQTGGGSNNRIGIPTNTTTTNKSITINDVLLGLNGLDTAQQYKVNNQYQSALKLYELSIELLIKFLGTDDDSNIDDSTLIQYGYTRLTIERRVHDALTDAEMIKQVIKNQQQQGTSENNDNNFYSNSIQSVTDSIKGTLRRMTNSSTTSTTSVRTSGAAPVTVPPSNHSVVQQQRINQPRPGTTTTRNTNLVRQRPTSAVQTTTVDPLLRRIDPKNEIHQTILRELYVPIDQIQNVTWDDIAGLNDVKQALQESAILPLVRPDLFIGLRKPRNILLYGPPGTGKTMLVKAVANESKSALFIVTSSTITSKWLGDGEKIVKNLFFIARLVAPSIIFIDEMDALLSSRKGGGGGGNSDGDNGGSEHEASRRLKTEFMIQIDGIVNNNNNNNNNTTTTNNSTSTTTSSTTNNLLLLACTNCPWDIDTAIVRRFQRRIYVPLPDYETRKVLIQNLIKQIDHHTITEQQIITLAKRINNGYSCSDITSIASEAAFGPIRSLTPQQLKLAHPTKDIRPVTIDDFNSALQTMTKSITPAHLERYTIWQKQQQ